MRPLEFWIIDDDHLYVDDVIAALDEILEGFTVVRFTMTSQAIAALESGRRPDACILDMMLPKDEHDQPWRWPVDINPAKSGIELAEKIRQAGVEPARIGVITAVFEEGRLDRLHESEIGIKRDSVLLKPALVGKIRSLALELTAAARRA